MSNILTENDICKEVYTVLSYFDIDVLSEIPDYVLKKIVELAAESEKDFSIDTECDLLNQNISEESKDLIALLYYSYIANEEEKNEIMKAWEENEIKARKELAEKYSIDKIFEKKGEESKEIHNNSLVKKEESIINKIVEKIKKIFNLKKQ